MSRFAHYLSIVALLALGLFISVFSGDKSISHAPTIPANNASSTAPITNQTATTSAQVATSTKKVPQRVEKAKPVAPAVPSTPAPAIQIPTITITVPVVTTTPEPSATQVSSPAVRDALVNVMCYVTLQGGLHIISASGVFIDPKGIIITNAHVAQSLLLADRGAHCTIRSGSPAMDRYEAKLIYISPVWLNANPNTLTETEPNGTGEYDFALLAVSKSATDNPLPTTYPYVPLAMTPPTTGTSVIIASYGAQFLDQYQVRSSLFPTIVSGSIKDIYTFAMNTIDVIALGGSAAAQEGSSGGGVANASGSLVGVITTSTVTGDTNTRSLDAITASYIRAEYANETSQALDILLSKPTATSIADFAPRIPVLEAIITANLP